MYSTDHPPYANELVVPLLPKGVKGLWNIRNDDLFNFRWGNPEYTARYYKNLPPPNVTAGMHMGSDGYVWARLVHDRVDTTVHGLEIEKHWYNFMMWGRCAFQACDEEHDMGPAFWMAELASRFPELSKVPGSAAVLYAGWANASDTVSQVNRLVIGKWVNDMQWSPEGCFNRDGIGGTGAKPVPGTSTPDGFVDVVKFAQYQPVEGSNIVRIPDYARAVAAGKTPSGITPVQVVDNLRALAGAAEKAVDWLRASLPAPGPSQELGAVLNDIKAFVLLGRYYADKLCGATELGLLNATQQAAHRSRAVACLQDGVAQWKAYAAQASAQYSYPQLLARVRVLDVVGFTAGAERDVQLAAGARGA